MKRILTVVGARPQFIKAAPVSRAFARSPALREIMVHTGQHHDSDMSDVFFAELEIPAPRHHLGIHGGTHGAMTGRMLEALERVMIAEKPDWVLVYGDTNSTLAGALTAAKLQIPVAHVEAGLRSFNQRMPEEINRVLADHVSRLLFCPTSAATANLAREGIAQGVHQIGDVMYDAMLAATAKARAESSILRRLGLVAGNFAVATVHRAENTDNRDALAAIIGFLAERAGRHKIVLPLHPRTRAAAERFGVDLGGIDIVAPIGHIDMASLLDACVEVLTDSGGLQKEAYFHRKPCVTLRHETEWIETVEAGWNRLWRGPDYRPRRAIEDYGDGRAAERVARVLEEAAA